MTEFREVSRAEIALTYPVMSQLRPHIGKADYQKEVEAVLESGARLVAAWQDGACVGCALFRAEVRLATGHMVYIDDLVTTGEQRSTGIGRALVKWVEAEAKRLGAKTLILDSGTQRERAHAFYFREGFTITSFNFKKPLD